MKTIVILITVLVSSISFARNDSASNGANCNVKSLTNTNSGLSDILKMGSAISDEKIKVVAKKLCSDVIFAQNDGKDIPDWNKTMSQELGFTGTSDEFSAYFNNFLNLYKNKITCPAFKVGTTGYPSQHLFKRIIAVGMDETFEEYFFDLDEGQVDFNAYDIVDGEKETVLDWIEKWLKSGRGDNETIIEIATVLKEDYGAKKGSQL